MKEITKKLFIHHRNLFLKGQFEYGTATSALTAAILLVIWLKEYILIWDLLAIPSSIILLSLLQYKYGQWFDKELLFNEDNEWHTSRNPIINQIAKNVSSACHHEWKVYSTSIVPPCILVYCNKCDSRGYIESYTKQEWNKAFMDKYIWQDNSRVIQH